MYVAAVAVFYLIFALIYEPETLSNLLNTGQGFTKIPEMYSFNLAITTAIVLVSTSVMKGIFFAFKEKVTATLGTYSLWCVV